MVADRIPVSLVELESHDMSFRFAQSRTGGGKVRVRCPVRSVANASLGDPSNRWCVLVDRFRLEVDGTKFLRFCSCEVLRILLPYFFAPCLITEENTRIIIIIITSSMYTV